VLIQPLTAILNKPITVLIDNVHCSFGEWVRGRNAGGSISYPTLHINPQFAFDITAGQCLVSLLMVGTHGTRYV